MGRTQPHSPRVPARHLRARAWMLVATVAPVLDGDGSVRPEFDVQRGGWRVRIRWRASRFVLRGRCSELDTRWRGVRPRCVSARGPRVRSRARAWSFGQLPGDGTAHRVCGLCRAADLHLRAAGRIRAQHGPVRTSVPNDPPPLQPRNSLAGTSERMHAIRDRALARSRQTARRYVHAPIRVWAGRLRSASGRAVPRRHGEAGAGAHCGWRQARVVLLHAALHCKRAPCSELGQGLDRRIAAARAACSSCRANRASQCAGVWWDPMTTGVRLEDQRMQLRKGRLPNLDSTAKAVVSPRRAPCGRCKSLAPVRGLHACRSTTVRLRTLHGPAHKLSVGMQSLGILQGECLAAGRVHRQRGRQMSRPGCTKKAADPLY